MSTTTTEQAKGKWDRHEGEWVFSTRRHDLVAGQTVNILTRDKSRWATAKLVAVVVDYGANDVVLWRVEEV